MTRDPPVTACDQLEAAQPNRREVVALAAWSRSRVTSHPAGPARESLPAAFTEVIVPPGGAGPGRELWPHPAWQWPAVTSPSQGQ